MSVRSGQSITKVFTTRVFSTGVATNADSTPTGTLYVNGTADAASVTVTNVATGIYKAAVTLPTLAVGDVVDLRIAATVSSVADTEIIWSDTKDLVIDSAGLTDANVVKLGPSGSGTTQTARDIGASVLLSVGTGSGQVNLSSGKVPATIAAGDLATDSITAAALKADAVTEIQSGLMLASSYTAPDNSTISAISTTIGAAGAGLTAIGDTRLANLDAAISTRLATSGYTAPDNTTIGTISTNIGTNGSGLTAIGDTRLGNLDAAVSTRLATSGYTAPDNASASSAASSASTAATQATNAASQTTAANIRTAVGLAAANLDSQLGAIPTTFRLKKNTAFSGFSLVMFNTAGAAATGKTVSGSVSIDGAAFSTLTNSVSEIGSGAYKVNLDAADTNGNDLLFLFAATDCKPLFLKVITQP